MEFNPDGASEAEAMHWLFGPDEETTGSIKESEMRETREVALPKQENVQDEAGTTTKPGEKSLNEMYYRCRAARETQSKTKNIELGDRMTVGQEIESSEIGIRGKFEDVKDSLQDCFMGSRIKDREKTVNQNVSMSVDPRMRRCIVCEDNHDVMTGDKRSKGFLLTDQHSYEKMCGDGTCLTVIRIEDGGLLELTGLLEEIVGSARMESGTIIGLGSLSYLAKVGTTCYSLEWIDCVEKIRKRFPSAQLVPLAPIPLGEMSGSLAVELVQLAFWYSKIYEGSVDRLQSTWTALVRLLTVKYDSGVVKDPTTSRIVALPSSLRVGSAMVPQRFTESHAIIETLEISQEERLQLLRVLRGALAKDFGLTGVLSSNVGKDKCPEDAKEIEKIVMIGASNMARTAEILKDMGYSVAEYRLKPGLISVAELETIDKGLNSLDKKDSAIVLDLHGNLSYRFEQLDGTSALPVKISGKHHLLGPVKMVEDSVVKNMISRSKSLLQGGSGITTVVVPPIPRYINGGCCTDEGHSTNVMDKDYGVKLLEGVKHVRKIFKKELSGGQSWVLDPVSVLTDRATGGCEEELSELGPLFCEDNVHLKRTGYERLAKGILDGITKSIRMSKIRSAAVNISGARAHWHGFESEVGVRRLPYGQTWRGSGWRRGAGHGSGPGTSDRGRGSGSGSGRGYNRNRNVPYSRHGHGPR